MVKVNKKHHVFQGNLVKNMSQQISQHADGCPDRIECGVLREGNKELFVLTQPQFLNELHGGQALWQKNGSFILSPLFCGITAVGSHISRY